MVKEFSQQSYSETKSGLRPSGKNGLGEALLEIFFQRLEMADMKSVILPQKKMLVALSGGGDSLALTMLLKTWCAAQGKQLVAVHVNHGLRWAANREEKKLRKLMAAHGISLVVKKLTWRAGKKNLHHRARHARYAALRDAAHEQDSKVVMLAHQQNDVAENLLMRLARRAGLHGLAMMQDVTYDDDIIFLRPLLSVKSDDLKKYLSGQGIKFFKDASNSNDKFLRARTRKLLKKLEKNNIVTSDDMAHSSRHLRDAANFVDAMAEEKKSSIMMQGHGVVILWRQGLLPANHLSAVDAASGAAVYPFLLRHWLRHVMTTWQDKPGDKNFAPPQYQLDKILSATQQTETIFDYPDYWVVADDKKITVIKKPPANIILLKPYEKIIWNKICYIENHGDKDCYIGAWGRGLNFLKTTYKKNFIAPDIASSLSVKARQYFYQSQPKVFLEDKKNHCLPSFNLTEGQSMSIKLNYIVI